MNDIIDERDVKTLLLKDKELRAKLIEAVAARAVLDPGVLESIGEEIADVLEDDPAFKRAILAKALSTNSELKETIVNELIEEMT